MISKKTKNAFFPAGTLRRKFAKALYQLLFARNEFKNGVKRFFSTTKTKSMYRLMFIKRLCSKVAYFFLQNMLSKQHEEEIQRWEEIYGEFDKTDYEEFTLRGVHNESAGFAGEFIKWSQNITPPPNRILLAGESRSILEYLRHPFREQALFTTGLSNADYEWNFERDPPSMGEFDLVMSQAILEHLLNPYKHSCDLVSITAPGGFLIVHGAGPGFPYHRFPIDACRLYPDWFEEIAERMNLLIVRKRIRKDHNTFYMYQKRVK